MKVLCRKCHKAHEIEVNPCICKEDYLIHQFTLPCGHTDNHKVVGYFSEVVTITYRKGE